MDRSAISSEISSPSHYINVLGSKMHYLEQGEGDPIVFIHGVPTNAYLWRNILPSVSANGRCIAVDLIGMGQSDKPDIEYSLFNHCDYISAFMDALHLKNITLVVHAWGSVIGLNYAMLNPDRIKALVFIESHIRPATSREMISLPVQELAGILNSEDGGYDVVMNSNYFVSKVLPSGVLRNLTEQEMEHYRQPFNSAGSCKPLWQYLQNLPLGEDNDPVTQLIERYSQALTQSTHPKLMMYAMPGFITTMDTIQWAKQNLSELSLVDIGDGLHYPQESNPQAICKAINHWYRTL